MKTRGWKMEDDGWPARSVLECGDSSPPKTGMPRKKPHGPQSGSQSRRSKIWGVLAALGSLLCVGGLQAQNYSINWSTIDGGGGTSTGGVFTVSGTIGQPDAGTMSGGNYTLSGGFWGIVAAIQNPPAPFLTVMRTTTNTVVVFWPGPEAGWRLQATPALPALPASWTELPPPYAVSGTNLMFMEPLPVGNKFYQLHQP